MSKLAKLGTHLHFGCTLSMTLWVYIITILGGVYLLIRVYIYILFHAIVSFSFGSTFFIWVYLLHLRVYTFSVICMGVLFK